MCEAVLHLLVMHHQHVLAASLLALALTSLGCHHTAGPGAPGAGPTTIENSAGSYAPSGNSVAGTNADPAGVTGVGVAPGDLGNGPMPDSTTPNSEALEPTAPAGPTP